MNPEQKLRILKAMRKARNYSGSYCCFTYENEDENGFFYRVLEDGTNERVSWPVSKVEELKRNYETFVCIHIVDATGPQGDTWQINFSDNVKERKSI